MEWMAIIGNSIQFIEEHITENITIEDIAKEVGVSSFYFQKGFSMLCGFSVSEYIRNRRLALAGNDLLITNEKIIDIALKYGYESPDSFAKAFTRFHRVSPSSVRKDDVLLKTFAPLKIKISLEGGYIMDYKIVKKDAFKVIANARTFPYEKAKEEVPENLVIKTIPAFDWAVFPCRGAMPDALQEVNTKIYTEWLPVLKEYEFAAGYCVEFYENPANYVKGTQDENYYCEIWIPIKKK